MGNGALPHGPSYRAHPGDLSRCSTVCEQNCGYSITSVSARAACSHRVFCCFHRTSPDNLSGRLSLEHSWLFRERIDASALFRGGFLMTTNFAKPGNKNAPFFFNSL